MSVPIETILAVTRDTINGLDPLAIARLAGLLESARFVFTVGNGGSASHASHCACDLAKLAKIPAICLNDSLPGMTAALNDDGVDAYAFMLRNLTFRKEDVLLIFSVGGGDAKASANLTRAAEWAAERGTVAAVLGRKGHVWSIAHHVVMIDCPVPELITPVVESVMPLVWHALVAGPLKREEPVWR